MTCNEARELITGLVDRELDPPRNEQVRAHAEGCADCRQQIEEEAALKNAVAALPKPEVPADLRKDLDRIVNGSRGERPRILRFASAAAGVLMVIGILILSQLGPPSQAEASEDELVSLHKQVDHRKLCYCCPTLPELLANHGIRDKIPMHQDLNYRGYIELDSSVLANKIPCIAAKSDGGSVAIFLFKDLPSLPEHTKHQVDSNTCLVWKRGAHSFVVVCGRGRHQIWVSRMKTDDLFNLAAAR